MCAEAEEKAVTCRVTIPLSVMKEQVVAVMVDRNGVGCEFVCCDPGLLLLYNEAYFVDCMALLDS